MKCCEITIGKLNRKITIERSIKTKNSGGGYDYTWSTLHTVYAMLKPKNGSERTHAGQLEATNKHDIVFRYISDLLPDDRVNYNGEKYQIRSIINVEEANKWTQLVCESGVVT